MERGAFLSSRLSYAIAVVVLLIAGALRLWDITTLPYGYNEDEILNVRITETIRQGQIEVFYEVNAEGYEGLHQTVMALTTLFTGDGTLGYRIISVWAGVLALAVTYTLGVRLYGTLAGLMAMGLLSVLFLPVLVSRLYITEALLPLMIAGGLLALARALPVYRLIHNDDTNMLAFAALGILMGISLYIHAAGLILVLIAMTFIAYTVIYVRPLSYVRLSLIGFAILMLLILAIPYLISAINNPIVADGAYIFSSLEHFIASIGDSFAALFLQSDSDATYNLPLRPLLEPVSLVIVLLGIAVAIRNWRQPRHALLLIAFVLFIPATMLAAPPPSHRAMVLLLIPIVLAFGLGVQTLYASLHGPYPWIITASMILLYMFNLAWTTSDLFINWRDDEQRQMVYHEELGQLAHHIDVTAGQIPTVLCYPNWDNTNIRPALSAPELVLIMLNRAQPNLRYIDCSQGLLFVDGGTEQQLILADEGQIQNMHPYLQSWLNEGEFLDTDALPSQRVIRFDVQDVLADAAGVFTTSSPAKYAIEVGDIATDVVPPPIRFGGNITWLGYVPPENINYQAGERVEIINYWRVEGVVPSDLILFHHILSDPVTVVDNRDEIRVNPRQLIERDVFIQITDIRLSETLTTGEYTLSIGTYQQTSQERLDVFDGEETRGNRLFLYAIQVESVPKDDAIEDSDITDEQSG
jgi:4-amino-4-deoxy-L-arabinose transferase-like glycosyltransferase